MRTAIERPRLRRASVTITPRPARRALPQRSRQASREFLPGAPQPENTFPFVPNPYVDYARYLTAEGGILLVYKDIDERWRHHVRRFLFWAAATGAETWFLLHHSPVQSLGVNLVCLLASVAVNWLIVRRPVEVYRSIEIRPDCMILEGGDVFWLRHMENGWPSFQPDEEDEEKLVLSGTYGTRAVEYLTVRRFDEFDRMPEVLAAHLKEAMLQLWTWPS